MISRRTQKSSHWNRKGKLVRKFCGSLWINLGSSRRGYNTVCPSEKIATLIWKITIGITLDGCGFPRQILRQTESSLNVIAAIAMFRRMCSVCDLPMKNGWFQHISTSHGTNDRYHSAESHPQLERSDVTDANLLFTLYKDARGLTRRQKCYAKKISLVNSQKKINRQNMNKPMVFLGTQNDCKKITSKTSKGAEIIWDG